MIARRAAWARAGGAGLLALAAGCAPSLGSRYDLAYAQGARAESAGRLDEALASYERAAGLTSRAQELDEARWAACDVLVREDRVAEAVERLDAMARDGAPDRRGEAAYRAAALRIEHGDAERGWRELEQIPRRYPTRGVAHAAVRRLVAHADEGGPEAGQRELAELQRDLDRTELVEMLAFMAAEHLETRGDAAGARAAYAQVAARWPYPYGAFFDDALWRMSVLDEKRGDVRGAIDDLERLVAVRETTTLVGSYERKRYVPAMLRIGELYRDGLHDSAQARATFHRLYSDFRHSSMRDDALWLEAAVWKKDGDARAACGVLGTLVREFPQSRYAPCASAECPALPAARASDGSPRACHAYLEREGWEPKAP